MSDLNTAIKIQLNNKVNPIVIDNNQSEIKNDYLKKVNFNSEDFTNIDYLFKNELINLHSKHSSQNLNMSISNETKEVLQLLISKYIKEKSEFQSRIEQNFNKKDYIVYDLMEKTFQITKEIEIIKEKYIKTRKFSKISSYKQGYVTLASQSSTYSKRSSSSIRSKNLGMKKMSLVNQNISRKVCININNQNTFMNKSLNQSMSSNTIAFGKSVSSMNDRKENKYKKQVEICLDGDGDDDKRINKKSKDLNNSYVSNRSNKTKTKQNSNKIIMKEKKSLNKTTIKNIIDRKIKNKSSPVKLINNNLQLSATIFSTINDESSFLINIKETLPGKEKLSSSNGNFKFEPKKRIQSSNKNSNTTDNSSKDAIFTKKESEDKSYNMNKSTRNIIYDIQNQGNPNYNINNNTIININQEKDNENQSIFNTYTYQNIYKSLSKKNQITTIDFNSQNQYFRFKKIFLYENSSKIRSILYSFLKVKDKIKLKNISIPMQKSFALSEISRLQLEIQKKREVLLIEKSNNTMYIDKSLIEKAKKSKLVLSEMIIKYSNEKFQYEKEYLSIFVDMIILFYYLNTDYLNKTTIEKIELLEKQTIDKNCYSIFEKIVTNVQSNMHLLEKLKERNFNFNLIMKYSPASKEHTYEKTEKTDFTIKLYKADKIYKIYNDLFKKCVKNIEENEKTEFLVDCEILEDKIEKVKERFL